MKAEPEPITNVRWASEPVDQRTSMISNRHRTDYEANLQSGSANTYVDMILHFVVQFALTG